MDDLLDSDNEEERYAASDSEGEIDDFNEEGEEEDREIPLPAAAPGPAPGILPYQFEPERRAEEEEDGDAAARFHREDIDGRLGNNHWCSCSGGCTPMPRVVESYCCKEMDQVVAVMDAYEGAELDCVTDHPGFNTVCLDRWVLDTAYLQYRQQYGQDVRRDASDNEKYRHVGYRQLARWCWGFLGRSVRVPLPSCAVTQIRTTFPSAVYRGFEEA